MKKYNVVFATSYEVEANDELEAEDIGYEKFKEDMGSESEIQLGLFGCNVEEKE
jgi:hypothetical protein